MALIEHEPATETPAVSNPVADILNRAADLIERDGWCQGGYGDLQNGPRCAGGALLAAHGILDPGTQGDYPGHKAALKALGMAPTEGVGDMYIAWWNDVPGRTQDEVVAKFRVVALAEASR